MHKFKALGMAGEGDQQRCGEWRVTVAEPLAVQPVPPRAVQAVSKVWQCMKITRKWVKEHWKNMVHCVKLGLAISLVSLIYYVRPLYRGFSESALGAILTAACIFELHVGETLYKGFTETAANLLAAFVAVCVHLLAARSGEKAEPIFRMVSVFILAFAATLVRHVERVKKLFEDGAMTFIIIFILLLVSGYRDVNVLEMAHQRMYAVIIGSSVAILVCMLLYPVWASNEIHLLLAKNMEKLATSLEGCVNELFKESRNIGTDRKTRSEIEGYKIVLDSKVSVDSLVKWARWEPPHGYIRFRHPWNQYLKIGAEVNRCAATVEAIHRCISSETEASEFRNHFNEVCLTLSTQLFNSLRELANSMKSMKKSPTTTILVKKIDFKTKELQAAMDSLGGQALVTDSNQAQPGSVASGPPIRDAVLVINFVTLLVESAERIKGIISTIDELAHLAKFRQPNSAKVAAIESGELISP